MFGCGCPPNVVVASTSVTAAASTAAFNALRPAQPSRFTDASVPRNPSLDRRSVPRIADDFLELTAALAHVQRQRTAFGATPVNGEHIRGCDLEQEDDSETVGVELTTILDAPKIVAGSFEL